MPEEPIPQSGKPDSLDAYRTHPRHFQGSQLVYPVLSRRSGGISVGVNLNPQKSCNFNCLYCQVRRRTGNERGEDFSLTVLETELLQILESIQTDRLYQHPPFDQIPDQLRRLNDIALSGDGEPTGAQKFSSACRVIAQVKENLSLDHVKIVLITNSSLLHRPEVQEGLKVLDSHQGEIWAKLDAGTEDYFKLINQTDIAFSRILENILQTARGRPIVIQSLFVRVDGKRPAPQEIAAYTDRLTEIISGDGRISTIQLHTIARPPRDRRITPLTEAEIDQIVQEITAKVNIPLQKFYNPESSSS